VINLNQEFLDFTDMQVITTPTSLHYVPLKSHSSLRHSRKVALHCGWLRTTDDGPTDG